MMPDAAIYEGTLRHRRFLPRRHEFTYSLFMVWLNVETIAAAMAQTPFTAHNRFHWASFYDADHFGDPRRTLRARIDAEAVRESAEPPQGPVYLLTHLRYLGYCFNPISFYFSDRPLLAEVNSTFGESHNYWLHDAKQKPGANSWHFSSPKKMRVSPFLPMNLDYRFTLTSPGDDFTAHVATLQGQDTVFDATLSLHRREWTPGNLARVLAKHPWMTAKVVGSIHWEALRLWGKGVPLSPPTRADGRLS